MRRTVMLPVRLYINLSHYLINGTIKKKVLEHEMCLDLLYKVCLKRLSFYEELSEILAQMYRVRHKSVNTRVRHKSVNTPLSHERLVVRTWLAV